MGNASTAAGSSDLLKIEQQGAVLTVGLNRPAKRNAINDGLIAQLHTAFLNLPEATRAVVREHRDRDVEPLAVQRVRAEQHEVDERVTHTRAVDPHDPRRGRLLTYDPRVCDRVVRLQRIARRAEIQQHKTAVAIPNDDVVGFDIAVNDSAGMRCRVTGLMVCTMPCFSSQL